MTIMVPLRPSALPKEYQLIRELGSSRFSHVWLARHECTWDLYVVKASTSEYRGIERLRREVDYLEMLSAGPVPRVIGYWQDEEQFVYAMQYIPGATLHEWIEGLYWSPTRGVSLAAKMAACIGYVHAFNIVHRDIKPGNFIVDNGGNVWIIDFGVSVRPGYDKPLEVPGRVTGTTDYISPEQAMGGHPHQSQDIYSFGVVLFELVTRALPFKGAQSIDVVRKHVYEAPPNIHEVAPDVPEAVRNLIDKCLKKTSGERPMSIYEAEEELS